MKDKDDNVITRNKWYDGTCNLRYPLCKTKDCPNKSVSHSQYCWDCMLSHRLVIP